MDLFEQVKKYGVVYVDSETGISYIMHDGVLYNREELKKIARVVELVDTPVLGTGLVRGGSSSLPLGTHYKKKNNEPNENMALGV